MGHMILRIGSLLGNCPKSMAGARATALSITTGFIAIGGGGVLLIGALIPLFADYPIMGFLFTLGLAAMCLGMGFAQATIIMRNTVMATQNKAAPPAAA
ncbi:hypothetical protein CFI11_20435 [Thalassococcus sp. S3]|nr:hypothetical protein CFI11_20435 [Thalassococcus sp. S3]